MESIAYTPKKLLEQIKGISEQKATKILTEGENLSLLLSSIHFSHNVQLPNLCQWVSRPLLRCMLVDQS